MNAGNIVNMVVRIIMRRVIGKGINAGVDAVGKRMSRGKTDEGKEDDRPSPGAKTTGKRMKQSMRMARRMGRF